MLCMSYIQNKKVVVFYGSQTGTAEEYATRLAKEATRHALPAMTFDPEECTDWVRLSPTRVCQNFICNLTVCTCMSRVCVYTCVRLPELYL